MYIEKIINKELNMEIIPIRYPWQGIWVGIQLIRGREKCVLIDTGIDDTINTVLIPELRKNGIPLSAISLVINTHFHGDHVKCNAEIRKLTGARFAIHRSGADFLSREENFAADVILEDVMQIHEDDIALEIIHTPGHSPDSICVLETSTGTLFSGDSLQGRGIEALGTPLLENLDDYSNSLKKLLQMYHEGKIRHIYLGHHFLPSNGVLHDNDIVRFLDDSLETTARYTAFARTMQECTPEDFHAAMLKEFKLHPAENWASASWNMANFFHQHCR